MTEHIDPVNCALQETRLKNIEDKLDAISDDMKKLLGYSGPLVDLNSRVKLVEQAEKASGVRLFAVEEALKKESSRLNMLAVAVGSISGLLGAGAGNVVSYFLR